MVPLIISYRRSIMEDGVLSIASQEDANILIADPKIDLAGLGDLVDTDENGVIKKKFDADPSRMEKAVVSLIDQTFSRPGGGAGLENLLGRPQSITPIVARTNGIDQLMAVVVVLTDAKMVELEGYATRNRSRAQSAERWQSAPMANASSLRNEPAVMWMARHGSDAVTVNNYTRHHNEQRCDVFEQNSINFLWKLVNNCEQLGRIKKDPASLVRSNGYVDKDGREILMGAAKVLSMTGCGMGLVAENVNLHLKEYAQVKKDMFLVDHPKNFSYFFKKILRKPMDDRDVLPGLGITENDYNHPACPRSDWIDPYLSQLTPIHLNHAMSILDIGETTVGKMFAQKEALSKEVQEALDDDQRTVKKTPKM